MRLAVDAGGAGSERRAWARVQLGLLRFGGGDLAAAPSTRCAARWPSAPATPARRPGLARVVAAQRRARGRGRAATRRRSTRCRFPSTPPRSPRSTGPSAAPDAAREDIALVGAMQKLLAANGSDVDLDLALIRADTRSRRRRTSPSPGAPTRRAPASSATRCSAGCSPAPARCAEGDRSATRSLRLGTRDALMLFHAGMAASCAGRPRVARERLSAALALNPAVLGALGARWPRRELAKVSS